MTPVPFPEANVNYLPPHNWPDTFGECEGLPVKREGGVCVSRWVLSARELGKLNAGGCIELTVVGGQPAVSLGVV